jgi:light-regulated signal transduction histidine kinase (bacteriophytochrome)
MEEWAEAFHCYHTDTDILLKPDELPLYRAINGMSSDDVEMVALNRGGGPNRYLNLVVSGRPLYDANNKLVGGLIVLRDVTSARATNLQLSSSNAELQSFAYVAAHDLQEPLRTVASYVDLLKRRYGDKLDERAASYIEGALAGARRMQNLVDDLLSLSRVETQAHPFEKVDTNAVVAAALENLQFAIDEAQAQVTASSLPDVRGDTSQLRQLFQNLIGNAIKFRAGRVPEIAISALKKGYLWQFAVKDNGIGIAAEYHEKVFQVFQRLHGQSEYPGTGIGLAICRKIVERHGGRIWVESEPGQGTTFFFTLPELIET